MNNNNYTNRFLIVALLMMVGLLGFTNQSNAQEAYAVFDETNGSLTFYYDDNKPEGAYGLSAYGDNGWYSVYMQIKEVVFDKSFKNYDKLTSTTRMFSPGFYIAKIVGLEYLNTENVTDMSRMFEDCQSLTNIDLSSLKTDNVTDMSLMFYGCRSLTSLDLSNFNTKNVTDMGGMFNSCDRLVSINFSNFNTKNVTNMSGMFMYCNGFFSIDLSNFNTSMVTNMNSMFSNCGNLWTIYVGDNWNTDNVIDSDRMFDFCNGLFGGKGTAYSNENTDVAYACIDGGSAMPGYFTQKSDPKKVAIKFTTLPKTDYVLGEEFNLDDAVLSVTFDDKVTVNVTDFSSVLFSGFDNKTIGKQTVTARFQDVETQFDVTVSEKDWGYAYYDETDNSLTLYYGKYKADAIATTGVQLCKSNVKKVIFDPSFAQFRPTNCKSWFEGSGLTEIVDMDKYLNTENVTNMSNMFWGCSLTTINVSNFKTDNVTNMSGMFDRCRYLTTLDVSNFKTDKVTDMSCMFNFCDRLTSLDVTNFETGNVTNMSEMFHDCESLTSLDVSNFNTAKVTNMAGMFSSCYGLTTLDVSNFNTDNVTDMSAMFCDCLSLTTLDVSNFNTKNVTDMNNMFNYCGLTKLDVSNFNTENVTNMVGMFCGCGSLTSLDVSNFNTDNVTYMNSMFNSCSGLTSLDLSNFNTKNVTNMYCMFRGCSGLTTLDLSSFNTEKVTDMTEMFESCSGLTSLDLSNFNTDLVTKMDNMFSYCTNLVTLDISSLNTGIVTDMSSMFNGCSSIVTLDLGNFNTENVKNMSTMFDGCTNLKTITVGEKWNTNSVTYSSYSMFRNCTNIVGGAGTKYDENYTDVVYAHIDGGTENPGYLTLKVLPIDTTLTAPAKLSYIEGEELDLTGGVITITFNNGETQTIALTDENVAISDFDNTKIGEQDISVRYSTKTFLFKVNVESKTAIAIELTQLPTKLNYFEGDAFVPDGGELIVTFNNKTSEILELAKATITGFDSNTIGEQTITVDYLGQKSEFKVNVKRKNPYEAPVVADDVYQISTAQDLFWFVTEVNNGHTDLNAVLVNDIVINQDLWKQLNKTTKAEPQLTEWNPIGTLTNAYSGTFDGQGHTISGVYINDDTQSNVGLFGVITETAVIKNLGVTDSYIKGDENVGAICGSSEGTIINCYNTSIIEGNTNVGAISGAITEKAVVANSYSLGKATKSDGTEQGVTGTAATQNVQNCYYLTENASSTDRQAKTAQQFKSGEVTEHLKQPVTIGGVEYKNEILDTVTELPGVEEITVPTDPEDPPTPVSETSASNIRIWSFGSTVYVENATSDIYIVNLNGSLITKRSPDNNHMEICLNNKGVFIVKTGDTTQKIIIQ